MTQADLIAAAVAEALAKLQGSSNKPVVSEYTGRSEDGREKYGPRVEMDPSSGFTGYLVNTIKFDDKGKPKSTEPSYWVVISPVNRGIKYQRFNGSVSYAVEFFYGLLGDEVPVKSMALVKFLYECWIHPKASVKRLAEDRPMEFPASWKQALLSAGMIG